MRCVRPRVRRGQSSWRTPNAPRPSSRKSNGSSAVSRRQPERRSESFHPSARTAPVRSVPAFSHRARSAPSFECSRQACTRRRAPADRCAHLPENGARVEGHRDEAPRAIPDEGSLEGLLDRFGHRFALNTPCIATTELDDSPTFADVQALEAQEWVGSSRGCGIGDRCAFLHGQHGRRATPWS